MPQRHVLGDTSMFPYPHGLRLLSKPPTAATQWQSLVLSGAWDVKCPHLARWPPRMSREPRTSGSSWSSSRNTRRPLLSVTCAFVKLGTGAGRTSSDSQIPLLAGISHDDRALIHGLACQMLLDDTNSAHWRKRGAVAGK